GKAGARSGQDWAELLRAGELGSAEGKGARGGVRPPDEAASGGCSPGPGWYPRPPPPRRVEAVGAAKGRARVGSDRGWRASVGRSRRGPGAVPDWAVSAWHIRLGSLLSRSALRGRAGCPRLQVCGSGLRAEPAGPEDAARPWAQRAGCTEWPRGACPGSHSSPPGARWPLGRQGECVCVPGPDELGIPVRTSSLPLFSDAMPAPTQLFFPLLRTCELSRIYGTACYCHHKHLCCSPPCVPQNRLRYTPHPAYATFCRPRENWWQYTQGRRYASTPQKFYLTPPQVNSILKANEYSFKVPEFDGKNVSSVLGFDSNQLPANAPIEDRRSAATCLQTRGMLLGVFDGHAGCACSQAVSERLFYYIAVSLLPHETLLEIENAVESGRALLPILQWHKHPNDYFSKEASKLYFNSLRTYWQELIDLNTGESADIDVKEALINAFKRLDNDISLEAQVGDPNSFLNYLVLRVAFSGATACVAHVDGVDLHVANTGDSRAMLGVQEEDGSWSAVTLSNDHNAQNERELERLKLEHPKNEAKSVVKQDRLLGLLMPFRAFGDVKFKWSIDLQKRVIESGPDQLNDNEYTKFIPPNYHTPPYLTAEPEVTYHRLRPQDKFLVLATDGLWETMHRQDVVRIVGEYLTGMHHQQPIAVGGYKVTLGQMHGLLTERRAKMSSVFEDQNAATHLIRHAVGNNEFGAVDHERLSKMLSLPEELARMYRDDITIIVVQFNSHVVGAYQNQEH
ncbi:[Pyruvate dehydrogenase [acetyl-transferring]]-phosphatase 1, mitochondrial, partial [Lemmus lemmus]